eukprot:RCo024565
MHGVAGHQHRATGRCGRLPPGVAKLPLQAADFALVVVHLAAVLVHRGLLLVLQAPNGLLVRGLLPLQLLNLLPQRGALLLGPLHSRPGVLQLHSGLADFLRHGVQVHLRNLRHPAPWQLLRHTPHRRSDGLRRGVVRHYCGGRGDPQRAQVGLGLLQLSGHRGGSIVEDHRQLLRALRVSSAELLVRGDVLRVDPATIAQSKHKTHPVLPVPAQHRKIELPLVPRNVGGVSLQQPGDVQVRHPLVLRLFHLRRYAAEVLSGLKHLCGLQGVQQVGLPHPAVPHQHKVAPGPRHFLLLLRK